MGGSGGKIITGRGWWRQNYGWSWVGGKIMTGRGWWRQNYGWSWVVVGGGGEIMAGHGWSWMVVRFSNARCTEIKFSKE